MKTTFLTLMAATLAVTTLTGCKKDSGDDDSGLKITRENVSLAVGDETIVRVYTSNGLNNPQAKNVSIAVVNQLNNSVDLKITGKSAGITSVELTNYSGDRGTITINVIQEDIAENGGFKVDKSTIFLKKNGETDVTSHIRGGSGNYAVSIRNSNLGSVRKDGGKFIVTGLEEGFTDVITFKDLTKNININVDAYVIVPFKTKNEVPTTVIQGWESTIYFDGIYIASTTENNNFDRMKVTATGVVTAEIKREYKNFSHPELGNVAKSITIKANSIGTGNVRIDNGDGQFINLPFSVKALTVGDYYNIDSDGVLLSLKPGVTLPSDVILPPNVKKVAEKVFKNHPEIKTINFNNVTEIEGNLFDNMATGGTGLNVISVEMPKVVKVGYDAFRNAKHLKKIKFPASLKFLGNGALLGCESLDDVAFEGTEPPKLLAYNGDVELTKKLDGVFSFDARNTKTLYVSIGRLSEYQKKIDIGSKFRKGVKDISEFK